MSRSDLGIFRLDRALGICDDAHMTDHLPLTRFDPALFEGWISLAADHLMESLEGAIDDLQRDRDFIDDAHIAPGGVNSPYFTDERDAAIACAVKRFLASLDALQEGNDDPDPSPAIKGCLIPALCEDCSPNCSID